MLVVAGAAAMALRGAGWWSRFYAWACLIGLLVAVAIGDAVHATGTVLPERATRAAVAITPWVLLLLAFGLLLTMLRHFRKARAAVAARQEARAAAAGDAGTVPAGRGQRHRGGAVGGDLGRGKHDGYRSRDGHRCRDRHRSRDSRRSRARHRYRDGHQCHGGGTRAATAPVHPGHAAGAQAGPGADHRSALRRRCRGDRDRGRRQPWRPGELRRGDGIRPPGQLPGRGRVLAARRLRWARRVLRLRAPRPGRAGRERRRGAPTGQRREQQWGRWPRGHRGTRRPAGPAASRGAGRPGERRGTEGQASTTDAGTQEGQAAQADVGAQAGPTDTGAQEGQAYAGRTASGQAYAGTQDGQAGQAYAGTQAQVDAGVRDGPGGCRGERRPSRGARPGRSQRRTGGGTEPGPRAGAEHTDPARGVSRGPAPLRRASPAPWRPRQCPRRGRSGPVHPWWSLTR